jgi:hypothetical protein
MSKARTETENLPVEWTVTEAAKRWGVSRSRVNKWREQGRIAWRWHDKFHVVIITQSKKPDPVPHGSLVKRMRRHDPEYKATG